MIVVKVAAVVLGEKACPRLENGIKDALSMDAAGAEKDNIQTGAPVQRSDLKLEKEIGGQFLGEPADQMVAGVLQLGPIEDTFKHQPAVSCSHARAAFKFPVRKIRRPFKGRNVNRIEGQFAHTTGHAKLCVCGSGDGVGQGTGNSLLR